MIVDDYCCDATIGDDLVYWDVGGDVDDESHGDHGYFCDQRVLTSRTDLVRGLQIWKETLFL